jgi:hypothetical protein
MIFPTPVLSEDIEHVPRTRKEKANTLEDPRSPELCLWLEIHTACRTENIEQIKARTRKI